MSSNTSSSPNIMSAAKSTKKVAAPAAPVVAVASPVPVPVPEKKVKAKKEAAAPVVAAPAPVAVPEVAAESETDGAVLLKNIEELHEQLSGLKATLQTALVGLKTLEKQAARVVKKAERRGRRKAEPVEGAVKKPCIFTTPVRVSDELCSFLALAKGSEVSRSAVTKAVMAYARAHNLMDKQAIKADAPLRKLLTLNEGDALTILNLQTYLSRHYVKAVPIAK